MKITKTRLKKIIREELEAMISEENISEQGLGLPKDTWIEQDVTCPEGTAWDGAQGKCTPGDDPRVPEPDPAPPVPPVPDVSNIADRPISKASQSIGKTPQLQSPKGLQLQLDPLDPAKVNTKLRSPETLTKEVPKRKKKSKKYTPGAKRRNKAVGRDLKNKMARKAKQEFQAGRIKKPTWSALPKEDPTRVAFRNWYTGKDVSQDPARPGEDYEKTAKRVSKGMKATPEQDIKHHAAKATTDKEHRAKLERIAAKPKHSQQKLAIDALEALKKAEQDRKG